ncbi:hypothetical protein CU043_13305, partial [Corynebacterium striatum]|nr:hypothetical protein [Corynebacterium striatum]
LMAPLLAFIYNAIVDVFGGFKLGIHENVD